MTTNTRTTIGFTFGTLCFMGFLAGLAIMTICGTLIVTQSHESEHVIRRPIVRPPLMPDKNVAPVGDLKQAELDRQYGSVNSSALNEVKEGLFSRMRARRQSCSTQAYIQPGWQTYHSLPTFVQQPYYVSRVSNCSSCTSARQPVLKVEQPMPQIDPSTCDGVSCELQPSPQTSPVLVPLVNPVKPCPNCQLPPTTIPSIYGT